MLHSARTPLAATKLMVRAQGAERVLRLPVSPDEARRMLEIASEESAELPEDHKERMRIIDAVVGEACRLQDHTATWTTGAVLERDGGYQKAAFGAVLGDRVCSAPFTVLKNCIVGNNAAISAGNTTVTGVIPDEAVVV